VCGHCNAFNLAWAPGHKGLDGRNIADVLLPDGTNVTHTLVKDCWCWWYREYAPGIPCSMGRRRKHERPRKAYGLIRSRCCHGSDGKDSTSLPLTGQAKGITFMNSLNA
jgi:hypothetical protein